MPQFDQTLRLQEKIEVLDGSRAGRDLDDAAVRLGDLKELLRLAGVKTQAITSAPTADDFNSLLKDVMDISTRLNSVALVIQARRRR